MLRWEEVATVVLEQPSPAAAACLRLERAKIGVFLLFLPLPVQSRRGAKRGVRRSVKMETGIKRFGFGVRRWEGAFWHREWFPRAGGRNPALGVY